MRFRDRRAAGRDLVAALRRHRLVRPVIVALPRGGVPVAHEVAAHLGAPLDVLLVRKLGVPGHSELGMGAIAEGGIRLLNEDLIARLGITTEQLDAVYASEEAELERRVRRYRGGRRAADVGGRDVVVIDDGVATGFTALAAVRALRTKHPRRIVVAIPVAPPTTIDALREVADDVVCLSTPTPFIAVGQWYDDFRQVTDDNVAEMLARHADEHGDEAPATEPHAEPTSRDVQIPASAALLPGRLSVPPEAIGGVIFAHGSGSSRLSPRNVMVARALHRRGIATLLFDLLDTAEAVDRSNVFDIDLLADRLTEATHWMRRQSEIAGLRLGYFGASTGAAAALRAAAHTADQIGAVVSRGGRPDLALGNLHAVTAPTLLIVGGRDEAVIELNKRALRELGGVRQLEIMPGATHLFSEPGALELVARLAGDWFTTHLTDPDDGGDHENANTRVGWRTTAGDHHGRRNDAVV